VSKQISPPKGRFLFDGGLNTKFEKTIIGDNESPDCLNVIFSNGAVGTREGSQKLNTTAIGSFVGDGIYTRHTNTGGQTMIVFAGGSAWQLSGSTFTTIPSAQSVFTAGIRVAAAEYQQHLFVGNGAVVPYKWNGTDWTRHGVYEPPTTSTVTSNAVGVLNGDYRYKITNVNSQGVESDVGPVTTTFGAANATLRVASIPVAPQSWGISSRRVYRNKTSATSTYFRVGTIADNSTTTFDDNIADASLGAEAPTDQGTPPMYGVIAYHRDRLFVNDPGNPNFINYSEINEPYTFKAENFWRFGDNTTDLVRCIVPYGENIAIFGDRSIEIRYMPSTDDTEWLSIKVQTPYGCKSPFGIVKYKEGLLFPAIQENKFVGFAHLQGAALSPSVTFLTVSNAGSELLSDKVEPDMLNVKDADVGELSAIVYENKAYFSVPYGSSATENNRIYVFDFSISNLTKNTPFSWAPWSGLYGAQFAEYSGDVYFVDGRANGAVRKINTGVYNDDGAAIDSYYWTKEFGGNAGEYNFHKDFRHANILADLAGSYHMDVTARVDSDTGSGNTQTVDIDPGGSLWGDMIWGTDQWGGGSAQNEFRLDLGTLSGKRIQFKYSNQNTVNQRFKVHGLNFLSNIKGFR
jgi:hypothetical protein